ncbi:MAG TPA: hypothetical protein VLJ60_06455, partial [bacterium]|nr:hypothetical protein [bacterium]
SGSNQMITVDSIGTEMKKNVSEFQALAVTIMNAPASVDADIKAAYESSVQQPTVVLTDTAIPKMEESGLEEAKVMVNLTGEDTATASWAVRIVPSIAEALSDAGSADEREDLLNTVRQASFDLVQREMMNCSVYLTESTEFNCRIDLSVPAQFSKIAYDTLLHYFPIDDKSSKVYAKSRKTGMPAIRVICCPDWVNEEWMYWKSRCAEGGDDEPPRIMMIYDIETNTSFLLGARSFSEVRKAVKILGWNTAVTTCEALPVNGTAKTVSISKNGKKTETTFLTISSSCGDRAFFGMNVHSSDFKTKNEEVFISGDSGMVMLTNIQGRKKALVNFGRNYFGSIDSVVARTSGKPEVISAENVAVAKSEKGEKGVVLNQIFSPNGKGHTLFKQAEKDLNAPEYLVFIVRDELLPPVVMIKDNDLISASWFTYTTECDCCSDMSILPGGNPNAVWDLSKELDVFDKALKKTKFKLVMLNSLYFFGQSGEPVEISDEILLSVYTKISKGEMKWKDWKMMPGYSVPEKNIFKNVQKDFDTLFDPQKITDMDLYTDMMRDSLEMKVDYLRGVCAPAGFISAFYKILSKLV